MTARTRPIIFGADSVRAILADRKTQTRRVLKREHIDDVHTWCRCDADGSWIGWAGQRAELTDYDVFTQRAYPDGGGVRCPYGVVGDRLWVREAWLRHDGVTLYRADDIAGHILDREWRSPILMPRWASRLTLEVTEVRVQRLQDITEADALAEGHEMSRAWKMWEGFEHRDGKRFCVSCGGADDPPPEWMEHPEVVTVAKARTARENYEEGWDFINARRGHGWDTNPWVWAVTFRRLV